LRKKLFGALFLLGLTWTQAHAALAFVCPPYQPPPLSREYNQASAVLVGHFANAQDNATGRATDFIVDKVLKSHDFLKGPKVRKVNGKLVICVPNRNIADADQFIIFCDVLKGEIDAYRGVKVQKGGDLVQYLKGAAALKDAPPAQRLRFCFDFLNSRDSEASVDAFVEFSNAQFADYKEMAKKLPAEKLASWLRDPKTPPDRFGLYASLLGQCGKPEHGRLLRELIDDPDKNKYGLDGVLFGYVSLQPEAGWKQITGLLKDGKQEFMVRYAALRAVRSLSERRPDVVPKKDLVDALALLLDHSDMADFAIEDLRKWKRWEMTDRILALFGQKSHEAKVIKRAILRFALASPLTSAADFVQAQRSRDPEWVRDSEEFLRLELLDEAPDPRKKQ